MKEEQVNKSVFCYPNRNLNSADVKSYQEELSSGTFEAINLNHNKIDDEGAKVLAVILQTSKDLKVLQLRGNKITSEGAKYIADAIRLNGTLEFLDLSDNEIGDSGIISIAGAISNHTTVKIVRFEDNMISNEAAAKVYAILEQNEMLTEYTGDSLSKLNKEGSSGNIPSRDKTPTDTPFSTSSDSDESDIIDATEEWEETSDIIEPHAKPKPDEVDEPVSAPEAQKGFFSMIYDFIEGIFVGIYNGIASIASSVYGFLFGWGGEDPEDDTLAPEPEQEDVALTGNTSDEDEE